MNQSAETDRPTRCPDCGLPLTADGVCLWRDAPDHAPTSPGGTASRWCAVHDEPAAECWSTECLTPPAEPAPLSRVQAIEAAEDHADQTAFDAWRERGQ